MTTISRSDSAGRGQKNTIRHQRDPGRSFSFLYDRPFAATFETSKDKYLA